jgi:hypothetical protein
MLVEHGNAIENPQKNGGLMGKSICKWANLCKYGENHQPGSHPADVSETQIS